MTDLEALTGYFGPMTAAQALAEAREEHQRALRYPPGDPMHHRCLREEKRARRYAELLQDQERAA